MGPTDQFERRSSASTAAEKAKGTPLALLAPLLQPGVREMRAAWQFTALVVVLAIGTGVTIAVAIGQRSPAIALVGSLSVVFLIAVLQLVRRPSRRMGRRPTKPKPARIDPGMVDFGDLRRLEPVSRDWGFDRGRPIDRYYIERFLEARSTAIRGRVLEIGDATYTEMFGGGRVTKSEILDVMGSPDATYTCGLEEGVDLPADSFDCIVVTQTLQYIYDFRAALRTLHRILKGGGTLLATVPGITRLNLRNWQEEAWYWSFTGVSLTSLFGELFARDALDIEVFGNVLSATGFLYGLAESELTSEELDHLDPNYQVIIGAHAMK